MVSKIKYVSPADGVAVDKLIDSAVKATAKARDLVQVALVGILIHAAKHNDYSRAQIIVDKLVGTVNANALVKWFVTFGGLIVAEDGSGFGSWQGPKFIADNLEEAKATMWYEFTKPNPFAGYNAEAELHKFMKRYATMRTKTEADDLSEEDKAKVDLHISAGTIEAVLKLVKMELIIAPDAGTTEQSANEEAEAPANVVPHAKPSKAAKG